MKHNWGHVLLSHVRGGPYWYLGNGGTFSIAICSMFTSLNIYNALSMSFEDPSPNHKIPSHVSTLPITFTNSNLN